MAKEKEKKSLMCGVFLCFEVEGDVSFHDAN